MLNGMIKCNARAAAAAMRQGAPISPRFNIVTFMYFIYLCLFINVNKIFSGSSANIKATPSGKCVYAI